MSILIAAVIDYLLAKAFQDIARKKGHTEGTYFWVPFLLPIIGYIMVLALPDNSGTNTQGQKNEINSVKVIESAQQLKLEDELPGEKYMLIYSLPQALYAAGAPVVISAGELYKDTSTGEIFVRLKLQSLSSNIIKAVKVNLDLLDTAERPLDQSQEHQYLDLCAKRGDNCAFETLFELSNKEARAFTAQAVEVIFSDNTIWNGQGETWEPLCEQVTATQELEEKELVKQYSLEYGADSTYIYSEQKDLWFCTCGKLNRVDEDVCWGCGKSRENLKKYDRATLQKYCEERLEKEAEAAEKLRIEKEEQKKRILKIAAIVTPSIIVYTALLFALINYIIPASNYNKGISFYEAKDYESAIEAFEAAGEYKDAQEQILACYYAEGLSFYENEDYESAIEAFEAAGEYKDAQEQILACYYAEGLLSKKEKDYTSAVEAFEKAGEYQNAAEQAELCFDEWVETLERSGNSDEASIIYKDSAQSVTLEFADVELTSDYYSKYTICTGKVKNTGVNTYYFIRVECAFKDEAGNILYTDWTYATGTEGLASGESTEFRLSITKDYDIKSGTVSILDCYVG